MLPNHPMIADVCGTLVHDDTTLGLLTHHFCQGTGARLRRQAMTIRMLATPTVQLGFGVLEKLSGRHLYKLALIGQLRGVTPDELAGSACTYAEILLAERRCAAVTEALAPALAAGDVVLASASLEPIVAAVGKKLGAPHVASRLELHDGYYTGRLAADLTGRKADALTALNGAPLATGGYDMISDNYSDLSMLRNSACAVVVLREPAHRARWEGKLDALFLEVYERP